MNLCLYASHAFLIFYMHIVLTLTYTDKSIGKCQHLLVYTYTYVNTWHSQTKRKAITLDFVSTVFPQRFKRKASWQKILTYWALIVPTYLFLQFFVVRMSFWHISSQLNFFPRISTNSQDISLNFIDQKFPPIYTYNQNSIPTPIFNYQ